MKKVTLFADSSKGGKKQWSIWIEQDKTTVTVEWGLVGMKLQTSSDPAKPKGKEGTKAYRTEQECALENYTRMIKKKREEGYLEKNEAPAEADWMVALDKNFVPAKPRNDMEFAELQEMHQNSLIWVQRKRDGQRHLVLKTKTGDIRIYSRRLEDMTDNFPILRAALKKLKIPNGTILDGEIIVDRDGRDDFRAVATMTKSKPEKSALREEELGDAVRFMVFDCLYFAGKPIWEKSYEYRYTEVLLNYIPADGKVFYADTLDETLASIYKKAKKLKWEGLVCWFAFEPTLVRNGGKPKRIGCAKLKPVMDIDVIATGFEYGSGEQSDLVGAVLLAEYGPDGKLRECGKCGTGFDMATRKEALKWKYPLVIKIEADKQEASGNFRFPVFIACHEDKTPDECVGVDLSDLE